MLTLQGAKSSGEKKNFKRVNVLDIRGYVKLGFEVISTIIYQILLDKRESFEPNKGFDTIYCP